VPRMPSAAVTSRPTAPGCWSSDLADDRRVRARDLGIAIGTQPVGPLNAITDVPGVLVGHATVCWGEPQLPAGQGPARTGVTAIIPCGDPFHERVAAGVFAANGVGEVVGSTAIREWGLIETPIMLTNSQSVGAVYDATVRWMMARDPQVGLDDAAMPVVGECDDSMLNDIRGMHILPEHVFAALDAAADGPVAEGGVGAGAGMTCYDFKGGIGTSSRIVHAYGRSYVAGVLVLTNFGDRPRLTVDGVPVGREIPDLLPNDHHEGSCIVVLATDAPLSGRQCERMAKRCSLGLAATGSYASDGSGEIMLAFSTAERIPRESSAPLVSSRLGDDALTDLFVAAVDATAEAVINSLCAAQTTIGRQGTTVHAIPLDRLAAAMAKYGRGGGPVETSSPKAVR
jgi:D-aminopeptidase